MPSSFETEIRTLILDLKDPVQVAEDLARRWASQLLSEEEQEDCAQFMVSSGLFPILFRQLKASLLESGKLPWAQLAEALGRAKIHATPEEIDGILEGAEAQNSLSHLMRSRQLDIWSRKVADVRSRVESLRKEELEAKKDDLRGKLQFIRMNQLQAEEGKVLSEIEAHFPEEPEFAKERDSYEMRRAREIISKANRPDPVLELERKAHRLPEDQKVSKDLMVERAKELASQNPDRAYDLALSLHFMDFHEDALDVLSFTDQESAPAHWLRLDLMIHAKRFVDALEEANQLESALGNDPETAFAVTYARARALKGLGQLESAVDLMRGLVNVRPTYKSAQSLLTEWTGGAE